MPTLLACSLANKDKSIQSWIRTQLWSLDTSSATLLQSVWAWNGPASPTKTSSCSLHAALSSPWISRPTSRRDSSLATLLRSAASMLLLMVVWLQVHKKERTQSLGFGIIIQLDACKCWWCRWLHWQHSSASHSLLMEDSLQVLAKMKGIKKGL